MKIVFYNIYSKEIKKIINYENTKAIYLVGSSKNGKFTANQITL